jgi:hypothetical protein
MRSLLRATSSAQSETCFTSARQRVTATTLRALGGAAVILRCVKPADLSRSEVKGVWFLTAKRSTIGRKGSQVWDAVVASLPEEYRGAMADPLASEWYPEELFGLMLERLETFVAEGDPARLATFLEEGTIEGISRFFRSVLGLATPAFVLRRLPALWKLVRRGAGTVSVEADATGATVRYSGNPFWGDARYRTLTTCTLRALLRMCTGHEASVREGSFTRDTFVVHIEY